MTDAHVLCIIYYTLYIQVTSLRLNRPVTVATGNQDPAVSANECHATYIQIKNKITDDSSADVVG